MMGYYTFASSLSAVVLGRVPALTPRLQRMDHAPVLVSHPQYPRVGSWHWHPLWASRAPCTGASLTPAVLLGRVAALALAVLVTRVALRASVRGLAVTPVQLAR